jgi:hypothetical protein
VLRPISPRFRSYLRGRSSELALPATRAVSDPLAEWALKGVRLDGRPFSFEGHEFLRAIYDDTAQHIVLSKAAQIGGTTWAILKAFHACSMGLNVMYFFPTRTDVLEFSKARVGPLLQDNPFLSRLMKDTDTAGLKRIGSAYLYLRGMQSTVGMKSVPADMIVFDELDEATPDAKSLARERLAHSDFKRIVELSNPSLPNYGIDEAFQLSDQRHWTVRCSHCTTWTALDKEFPEKLGQEVRIIRERDGEYCRVCPKCGEELDVEQGEWVADFPDRKTHGYRISQLFSPKVDPGEILEEYRRTRFPERFYNLKIGIAWADTQNRMTAAEVLANCGDHGLLERSRERCTMGVDTGTDLHVVVSRSVGDTKGRKREVIYIGTRQSYADLDELMSRYNVRNCVIDALPEIHATREFARRFPGRVYVNYFVESQRGSYAWDRPERIVRENRTEALDASRKVVRDGRIVFPRAGRLMEEFADHMAADVKQLNEDEATGAKAFRYVRTATDHYSLAFTYDCIAWSRERRIDLSLYGWIHDDDDDPWRNKAVNRLF